MNAALRLWDRAGGAAPIGAAIIVGFAAAGLVAAAVGLNPIFVFVELIRGGIEGPQFFETLARSVPLVGMAVSTALPLRGGMVNLGGDGQLVLGGLAAALVAVYLPAPDEIRVVAAMLAAALAGGAYAACAALGEILAGVPMLVSTWLLSYPARGICAYLVRFPFQDPNTALPSTDRIAIGTRLGNLIPGTPVNTGLLLIAVIAVLVVAMDRRTTIGFELRLRGLNERFTRYGGVGLELQTVSVMFASGAIAGLVGAVLVLGAHYRFIDGALIAPQYTASGMLAALLADGEPVGAICAAIFFAALQTGGFAMERSVEIPRVLTMVLESVIILFLSMRVVGRRRRS